MDQQSRDLKALMRTVPDFPKAGINFIDITPLIQDADALREVVKRLADAFRSVGADVVAGIESRGFIFGAAVAVELGVGFVPIRKPGKLPATTTAETYELEYGTDTIEVHTDAIAAGQKVLMIDDLLATGGTMAAACRLIERLGGKVAGIALLVELTFLNGRGKLAGYDIASLTSYDGE